jgi:hypothetical protein
LSVRMLSCVLLGLLLSFLRDYLFYGYCLAS